MLLGGMFALAALQQPALPKSEASKLADDLREALIDAKAASALVKRASTLQSKYDFGSLVGALRAGPDYPKGPPKPRGKGKKGEQFETYGTVLYGMGVTVDEVTYRYGVDIPRKYDPRQPAPLVIDPGHGTGADKDDRGKADFLGYYRNQADAAGLEDALVVRTEIVEQIGAGGKHGAAPEDRVARVFDELFRDLCSRFSVDLDRVFVAGLSQTGFWAWQLGNARADRFAGIAPMSAVSFQQRFCLPNFRNLSVFVLHGEQDPTCPVAQPRETSRALEELGVRVEYREIAGAAHDFGVWKHLNEGLRWIAERPRDPYPKQIAKNLQTLEQPWCYWLRFDEIAKGGSGEAGQPPKATLAASIDGQEIVIRSEGVKQLTLALASELVDLSQPITVRWNDKPAYQGTPERDFARTIETALEKVDWRGSFEAFVELRGGK